MSTSNNSDPQGMESSWTRRDVMAVSGGGLASLGLSGLLGRGQVLAEAATATASAAGRQEQPQDALGLSSLANFCSHEHWGSIDSIGSLPEGFRADVVAGALPRRRTTLVDLILNPYLNGCLLHAGVKLEEIAEQAGGATDIFTVAGAAPAGTLRALRAVLRNQQLAGMYQSTRRGVLFAYGFDINSDEAADVVRADQEVGANYSNLFDWYRRLMGQVHFSELIRPVHPEFYVRQETAEFARRESAFTHSVMRIDPLLDLPGNKARREGLAKIAGVDPADAGSWRRFLDNLFKLAAAKGCLGIKQLQAYSRPLLFEPRSDAEVKFTGELNGRELRVFQDWVVHECCRRADDLGWPHQVHVGTNNLPDSNPLPLQSLAARYPRQKLVMIHCWPYLEEAGTMAKYAPNIFLDTCWQPVLSPEFFRQAMRCWLSYVPISKMMLAHDSTTIEMAVGSSLFTREILAEVLLEIGPRAGLNEREMRRVAADLLHNNAVALYRIGQLNLL